MYSHIISILLIFFTFHVARASRISSPCPNACSRKGYCYMTNTSITSIFSLPSYPQAYYLSPQQGGYCLCFPGYTAADCSQRLCPAGRAWVDFPNANNSAHANFTECSNMVKLHIYYILYTSYTLQLQAFICAITVCTSPSNIVRVLLGCV